MMRKPWMPIWFCMALAAAGPAHAQASNRVAAHTDWNVFVADTPKECYIVAQPSRSTARRSGQDVTEDVNRGDIRLFVTFRPVDNVANEVSFTGGYPFRDGSAVKLEVGGRTFDMAPGAGDGIEWAWTDPSDDASAVAAMRSGATAEVTGISSRGTTTTDTFSLMGFTAAVTDAEARCK